MKKSTKTFIALLTAASVLSSPSIMAVGAAEVSTQNVSAVTQNNAITVSPFSMDAQLLDAYNEAFKVSANEIQSASNNGGQYASRNIKYAIDGDNGTFWETGKPNSNNFTNFFEVTFTEEQQLRSMTFLTRQDSARGKGFPLQFEILAAETDNSEYVSVGTGAYPTVQGSTVLFQFPNVVNAKKIKFVFNKAHQDWTSAAEIGFYKQDVVSETIDQIFTNNLKTRLASEYNSPKTILELSDLLQNHPLKSQLQPSIDLALQLVNDPKLSEYYEQNVFTLEQLGSPTVDSWTHKAQVYQLSDLLPTGLYYVPGETFILDVEATNDKPPAIAFDQNFDVISSSEPKAFQLKPGRNIITAPKLVNGGGVYFVNNYLPEEQASAPQISIKSGGNPYPIYYDGVTDVEQFKQSITEHVEKMKVSNVNGQIIVPNLVTLVTEHVLVMGLATDAYKTYVQQAGDPQKSTTAWESLLIRDYELLGYTEDAESPKNRTPKNRLLARAVKSGLYAAGGHIGISYTNNLLGYNFGWAIYHEVGHVIEPRRLRFLELTNNLFSLINQEQFGESVRYESESTFNNLWNAYISGKTLGFGYGASRPDAEFTFGNWESHLMLWQLRIAFGEEIFTDAFTKARNESEIPGARVPDYWARYTSEFTGYDLGKYLHRMGMNIQESTLEYTSQFNELDLAIQYADSKVKTYTGSGFEPGYVSSIESVKRDGGRAIITINDSDVENDLMGFEVYRNGELIGYTNKDTFIDTKATEVETANYTVVAYDYTLRAAEESEMVTVNPFAPIINTSSLMRIAVGDSFNPLSEVQAYDINGKDISDRIEVAYSTVDPSQSGVYELTYRATDANGYSSEQDITVIVEDFLQYKETYASDLNWKQSIGSYTANLKDKSISNHPIRLFNGTSTVTYDKGLGVHSTSTIVYDIDNSGYEKFEAVVGVDRNGGRNGVTAVQFEVYVDGIQKFNSGIMNYNTPSKLVSINTYGAKEIKLVMTDGGNGNGSDHGNWADAKFLTFDSLPSIEASDLYFYPGEQVDLLSGVTATDVEDGILTPSIETNYEDGLTGQFDVTYIATDSAGNANSKTVQLYIPDSIAYASDIQEKSVEVGWGTFRKDTNIDGGTIQLKIDGEVTKLEKGLGAHANSEIVYDLTDLNAIYFTAYAGIDYIKTKEPAGVIFQVYVDDVLVEETALMTANSNAKLFSINVAGAKELKLVADGDGFLGHDHAIWGDAKFLTIN